MATITNFKDLDLTKSYTYTDYLTWKFKERLELLRGKIFKMSPAPNLAHQKVALHLTREFANFFYKKPCQVFAAPFDVRLKDKKKGKPITTVVQPDLCVVCDEKKLDERGCVGSPDLMVELLSPGNTKKEMKIKFDLYKENKVQEYWIIHPTNKVVLIYSLQKGEYIGKPPLTEDDKMKSSLFPKMQFDVKELFLKV